MPRLALPTIWSNFGLNVGVDVASGGVFNLATIQAEATYHVNVLGIKNFRIASAGYKYTIAAPQLISYAHQIVQTYLALGANVQYVLGYGGGFNASYETTYNAYITQEAAWSQYVRVQRLQVENELEINTDGSMTNTQVRDYLQTLPAIARAAGFTGKITYCLAGGVYAFTTVGNFDDLGIDTYIQYQGNINGVVAAVNSFVSTLGANTYVSEWGAYSNLYTTDPELESQQMMLILNYLKGKFSVPCYMYGWKTTDDSFAAQTISGNKRLFWFDVTSQRRPIIKYPHDFVALSRQQIGAFNASNLGGKVLWLKADAQVYKDAGVTSPTNGQTIQQWNDQSGQGNHAIQTTLTFQPRYNTNALNSLPTVSFIASNFNILQCLNPTNFNIDNPTLFVVAKWYSGSDFCGKGDTNLYGQASFRKLQLLAVNSTTVQFYSGTDSQGVPTAATMTNWNIFMAQGLQNNLANMNVNGIDNLITPTNSIDLSTFNSAPFVIGAGFYNNGGAEFAACDIAEILLFDHILTKLQYQGVIDYLHMKWGITVTNTPPPVIPSRSAAGIRSVVV